MMVILPPPPSKESRRVLVIAATVLALAAVAAYHNSFHVPFIFDDRLAILDNPSIRRLWPVWSPLIVPARDMTVSGRPVANLSLAVNYAISGTEVWSYHALNLLIHLFAGLTLFGVVRRTLLQPPLRAQFGRDALPLGFFVALLWLVHPLETEAVTYTIQRVESLMALFYLLTLYCFIRAVESTRPRRWWAGMLIACSLGMGTKEVMVSAPVIVLLYDRTFVSRGFVSAFRKHRRLYAGLFATWVVLLISLASTGWNRGGASGFDVGVTPMAYWLTQFEAVARYLWLAVWPHPLIFEYGTFWTHGAAEVAPYALIVLSAAIGSAVALWRWPVLGFLGFWFFAILAPTSMVPGTVQMIVEHRMYLALATVLALLVVGLHAAAGRKSWPAFGLAALSLGYLTVQRNEDYRSELNLWSDTLAKRPNNPSAHVNFGMALTQLGRGPEAIAQFQAALELKPNLVEARNDLGFALDQAGRFAEAIEQYEAALRLAPEYAGAHYNLANALVHAGQVPRAAEHYESALRLKANFPEAHFNLALALDLEGQVAGAISHYQSALELRPDYAEAHSGLGADLDQVGRAAEALEHLETAVRLAPANPEAHYNLGNILAKLGRLEQAVQQYEIALQLRPSYPEASYNLANVYGQLGRLPEASQLYETALRLKPDYAEAHNNYGVVLCRTARVAEAVPHFEEALRLKPEYPGAEENLAKARAILRSGKTGP